MELIKSPSVSVADSSTRSGFAYPHTRTSSLAAAILSGILSFTGLPSTNSADCTRGECASTFAAEVLMIGRSVVLGGIFLVLYIIAAGFLPAFLKRR